jgi:maltose alpha-D-glucosyltransferase/alpha-amylase
LNAWVRHIRAEAQTTLDVLQRRLGELPATLRTDAENLIAARKVVLEQVTAPDAISGQKIRHHGDYHLGQVLLRDNDWVIIDFEGEPTRGLEERRIKRSPLRDVSGMLRSFSYAAAAALERATPDVADRDRQASLTSAWEEAARGAFLDAYRKATAGSALFPSADAVPPLLRLFELEKALYELRYELENRPSWVGIPLRGINRLVALG